MGQERVSQVLDRIERAVARIEAAAARESTAGSGDIDGLREAHEALRGKVQSAILQIDRLLETEVAD